MRFLFCLFLFLQLTTFASGLKHDGIWLHRSAANFGTVESWISTVDSFPITNTSSDSLYILQQHYPPNFEVRFPRNKIAPQQTVYITVIYKPKKPGKFKQELAFYHSNSNKAFYIQYEGEIKALDPYYEMACPSFKNNKKAFEVPLKITVVDTNTFESIQNAQVEIWDKDAVRVLKTNSSGVVRNSNKLGKHLIYVSHPKYQTKSVRLHLNPKTQNITITLPPLPKAELAKIEVNKEEKKFNLEYQSKDSLNPIVNIQNVPLNSKYFNYNNLVFVLDISSSMRGKDRLPYMKKVLQQLIAEIRPEDQISILCYNDDVEVLMQYKSKNDYAELEQKIDQLVASGTTNGGNAVKTAYKIAKKGFIKGGNNQVIIFTDGGFNGLGRSENALYRKAKKEYHKKDIAFSALTFGSNKFGKDVIENMVSAGGGNYLYINEENIEDNSLNEMIKFQSFKGNKALQK